MTEAFGMKKTESKKAETKDLEINILPLLKEIVKRLWLIVLVGLVVGGAAFIGTKILIKPIYRSFFTAYVNNKQVKQTSDYLTSSDVNASTQIVQTYKVALTSSRILSKAAKEMGIDKSYDSLRDKVSTEVQDETQIITVYVVSNDPSFAYKFADSIAKTAPDEMAKIVEGSSMNVIDYPVYSDKRYKPSYIRYGLVGFIIGALIIIIYIVIRYFMDDTIKSETDMESRFSLPILGVIPDVTHAGDKKSGYYSYDYYSSDSNKKSEQKDEKEE